MTTPSTIRRAPGLAGPILSRVAWRIAMSAAGRVKVGRLHVVLPDGSQRTFGEATAEPVAEIHIHDRGALTKLLIDGETGGGEAYMDGLWSSPDLAGLLRWAALNRESLALSAGWFRAPAQPVEVQRRLAAAAEIVSVFEMANKSAYASAWLREMDEVGYVPARVLRQSTGDEISVKSLLEASVAFTLGRN